MDRNAPFMRWVYARLNVALRKESVDRNIVDKAKKAPTIESLSARRAWIEILFVRYCGNGLEVALRKESVDRNGDIMVF